MSFTIQKSIEILERTPNVLKALLNNISDEWTHTKEGEGKWSAHDVVAHLVHGEKTDWIARTEIILSDGENKTFEPFDHAGQFESSKGKNLSELLEEFESLRADNLERLRSKELSEQDLKKKGFHPSLGEVTLTQLIATWAVHDLNHLTQISRVMATQYKEEVGPWKQYLKILQI